MDSGNFTQIKPVKFRGIGGMVVSGYVIGEAIDPSEIAAVCMAFGLPWPIVDEAPGLRAAGGCGFGVGRTAWTGPEGR